MSISSIGSVNFTARPYGYEQRRLLEDVKLGPGGIYDPAAAKRTKRVATAATVVGLAALAFLFRGKIKQGYQLAKPYIAKGYNTVKNFVKTKSPKVFDVLKSTKNAAVDVAVKAFEGAKGLGGKAINAVKGIFKK